MGTFIKVARKTEIAPDTGLHVQAGGKDIALFLSDGKIYAVYAICPHAGGPLNEGGVTNGAVMCPWHGWEFDLKNGKCLFNESIKVPVFKVKEEGDDILIEV